MNTEQQTTPTHPSAGTAATSDEALRVRIARACGWKQIHHGEHYDTQHQLYGLAPDSYWDDQPSHLVAAHRGRPYTMLPNYAGDLNAMHEAEQWLAEHLGGLSVYLDRLYDICGPAQEDTFCAPARARATAFLAVLDAHGGAGL